MGISGSTTGELTFDGCRIPAGEPARRGGRGLPDRDADPRPLPPGVAAQALGIAQGATDYALEYAKTRETMGKPIAQHQLIQAKLADMETECEAARGLLYRFGRMVDEGADDAELTKASAMAKLKCGDVAMAVTTDAVQILGGYGYIKEYPVERFMRDAKITQIYEGTQEIQRLVIAREMVKRVARLPPGRRWLSSGARASTSRSRAGSGTRGGPRRRSPRSSPTRRPRSTARAGRGIRATARSGDSRMSTSAARGSSGRSTSSDRPAGKTQPCRSSSTIARAPHPGTRIPSRRATSSERPGSPSSPFG